MTGASSWLDGHDQRRIVPGLERISALSERLGNPQNKFKSIHVAGSDGKGSVCAMVYSVLRASGIRTGSFSSPFIEDRTESISVDGRNISSEDLESVLEEVREADRGIGSTFFEILTAAAFLWFSRCGVEYAVIETGMGGREDSTNIVTPDVSVITNISLEHTGFLGDTIEGIASHKAGIIKPGRPAVVPQDSPAIAILRERAESVGAPLTEAGKADITSMDPDGSEVVYRGERYRIGIPGSYQASNMPLAVEALLHSSAADIVRDHIRDGLRDVSLEARMEKVPGMPLVIDGTHTVAGMRVLCRDMKDIYGRFVTVFGVLDDKDADGMARLLSEASDAIVVTAPESDRAKDPGELHGIVSRYTDDTVLEPSVGDAFERAMGMAEGRTVLITGSFRMAEAAIRWLRTRYA
jgi:dihydrofolate synthase/folylpolyglutamate synthase